MTLNWVAEYTNKLVTRGRLINIASSVVIEWELLVFTIKSISHSESNPIVEAPNGNRMLWLARS